MDPISLGALTTMAVSLLLPYLGKAGEAAFTKAGEELFGLLKARFTKEPAAEAALEELAQAPQDAIRQRAVATHVGELLRRDPAALSELQELLRRTQLRQAPATAIQQNAGDDSKQFGQVFGNVSFTKD